MIGTFDNFLEVLHGGNILASHRDADGITCAVLLAKAKLIDTVFFPEEFGEYTWDVRNVKANLMTDMKPIDANFNGLVIDHHPDHPENRRYRLIWDDVPASLIVWRLLKHFKKLNEEDKWKVVVGCAGDGQVELTPVEIWETHPELLEEFGRVSESYGRTSFSPYPVYLLLSSYINAPCRIGQPMMAFNKLLNAKSPFDILMDRDLQGAKELLRKESDRVLKEYPAITIRHVVFWVVESEYNLGYLASKLSSSKGKTVLIYNRKTRQMSIRGALSSYLAQKLNERGVKCGGHAGFIGGRLNENQDEYTLLKILREVSI